MDVFNLQSTISLDSSNFFSGLRKSERGMKDFGDKMSIGFDKIKQAAKWLITGAAIKVGVDAVKSLATATANAGDRIDKASQALGLSRKAYQEWEYILSQSGATIDSLGISMKTLTNAIVDGSEDTNSALSTIGLAVSDLEGLSQEQAFEKVVRAFQRLPAGVQKSSAAVKLFGRNGQELLPLLNSDIYSIDILRAKAMDLGLVMSDDAVNASVAYTDALDTLQRTFNGLRYSIGAKVLPVLTTAFTRITNYAGKISRAYKDEGLSGVFKTVISDIRNIKWPSWEDVEKAATKAWDDIKKGALTLGGLVFGKKEDGSVDWPGWPEVVNAATDAWDGIKEGALTLVGLVLGKKKDGTVNWPTWPDVRQAAIDTWKAIKQNALDLGGAVFGRKEDGSVNWPTWKDVLNRAQEIWGDIKRHALGLGGVIFGTKENGEVNWPDWNSVKDVGQRIWNTITQNAHDIGGIVFGKKEDGSVNWPTWNDVKIIGTKLWEDIKARAEGIGAIVFGRKEDGSVAWPQWKDVKDAGIAIWDFIKDKALGLGGIVFGRKEDGSVNWPQWSDVRELGVSLWNKIKENALNLGGIVFGRKEDGSVDWPSWSTVKAVGIKFFDDIKERAIVIGGIVFGRKEDGSVNWPTWNDVKTVGIDIWNTIKEYALNLGGVVFGKSEDGSVNWPTWNDVKVVALKFWDDIKARALKLGGVIFGTSEKGDVNWPTWKDLKEAADDLWQKVVKYVGDLGGLIFGDSEGSIAVFQGIADAIGAIGAAILTYGFIDNLTKTITQIQKLLTFDTSKGGLNKTGIILAAIAAAFTLIAENWDDIKPVLENAIQWMDTNFFQPISKFIQDFIIGPVQEIIDKVNEALVALGILPKEISREEAIELGKLAFRHFGDTGEYVTLDEFIQKRFGGTEAGKKLDELNKSIVAASLNRQNPELAKMMGYTVLTDEEYQKLLNDFYEMLGRATSNAEEAKTAVEEVGEAADNAAGERNINFDVTTSGEEELLSTGRITRDKNTQTREINTPEADYEVSISGHGGSFAKGLWDVPYNDFPALLHEGEMVLTKTQANEYRDGGGSATSNRAIVGAIQRLENTLANLRLMVGEKEFGRATTEYGGRRMNNYIGAADGRIAAGYGS